MFEAKNKNKMRKDNRQYKIEIREVDKGKKRIKIHYKSFSEDTDEWRDYGSLFEPRGWYAHTLPIRVCAAQRGRDFEAPDLERGIIFRTHESSSFVSSHLKLFKDRLLLKIRFNALTSKLLYSCCTLCFSVQGEHFGARHER